MSDQRTRDLERTAAQGDASARAALVAERCQRREQHRWSCWATDGGWCDHIWCIDCLARRPKDQHEIAVEAYLEHMRAEQGRMVAGVRSEDDRRRVERRLLEMSYDGGKLILALRDYREAIAPHRIIMVLVEPPSSTAT